MSPRGILIVEDENIVALDMKMRLESLGYLVLGVVDSGKAALDFLSSSRPDLVLMDIKLKGNPDGIETARAARASIDVPIIFVTAFTDEATLERAKLASPYGYIVKPFHERELRIGIELALYKFQYELSIRHSKDLAEEANRLKGEFLANVSHELKTPLNSVIGFTELSLDRSTDEEQREYLDTVLRSARSLATLIDSILDFSRLENGSLLPLSAAFSLDDLLGDCVEFLAVGAATKGLDLSYRRDPALPGELVGDSGRLRQILMNLADNAVKFTERGRIRLCVDLVPPEASVAPAFKAPRGGEGRAAAGNSIELRFSVEDSGMGMPHDKLSLVFDRFTQLDGSTTRPAGGTGLGLAIVERNVDLLGGSISVKSAPGQGSRFEVLLPMQTGEGANPDEAPPLVGRRFAALGFGEEAEADIVELLESLGAQVLRARDLAAVAREKNTWLIVGETLAIKEEASLAALRGRVIVACRPGFVGRSALVAVGCAIVLAPLRAGPLLGVVDRVEKTAALPPGTEVPRSTSPRRDGGAAARDVAAAAGARLTGETGADFGVFLAGLESALAQHDEARVERESLRYRDIFRATGGADFEKLAFSALLLSRKGDWAGIEELVKKGRRILATAPGPVEEGGTVHAFPGR